MKFKIQPIIIILGFIFLCIGTWQMLKTETMMLSPWFLVLLFLPILIVIICSIFYASQSRPTHQVIIPNNFSGEVKLFVSNEKENDFKINNFGVGYIDKETFDKGFYPKIIRENNDITDQVKLYSKGSWVTTQTTNYSFEYLTFVIPPEKKDNKDVGELLEANAVDTKRLPKK